MKKTRNSLCPVRFSPGCNCVFKWTHRESRGLSDDYGLANATVSRLAYAKQAGRPFFVQAGFVS